MTQSDPYRLLARIDKVAAKMAIRDNISLQDVLKKFQERMHPLIKKQEFASVGPDVLFENECPELYKKCFGTPEYTEKRNVFLKEYIFGVLDMASELIVDFFVVNGEDPFSITDARTIVALAIMK